MVHRKRIRAWASGVQPRCADLVGYRASYPDQGRGARPGRRSRIVYPAYIPGGRWRDRLWRHWLSPRSVMWAFRRLQQDDRRNPVAPPWTAA